MKVNDKFITGILAIVIGVMFIVMKGEILSLAITAIGIAAIVMGIVDISKDNNKSGIVKIVAGVIIITCGWIFAGIMLYIIAALMIVYCLYSLVSSLKTDGYPMSTGWAIKTYAKPGIGLIAGICLLLNQAGTVSWAFIVAGIIFIAEGVITLSECKK